MPELGVDRRLTHGIQYGALIVFDDLAPHFRGRRGNPGSIPEDEDFAQWFFEEKKTGYDVQYAAAAVMMFRYYGIPSRYVEGYLLTPETVKEAGTAETVTVSQKYAHAWPEIYLDGMGWIPIEVTPKYDRKLFSHILC